MEPDGSLPHSQVPSTCLYFNIYTKSKILFESLVVQSHETWGLSYKSFMFNTLLRAYLQVQLLLITEERY